MSWLGESPAFPGVCGVGAVGFERVGWGLWSRRLVCYRAGGSLLLPRVLGVQNKDQLDVLHPVFHEEEGEGNCQCIGEGTQAREGSEGWDTEQLGTQTWCAHSRAPLTSSPGFPFPSHKVSHLWEKDGDAMM